MASILELHSNEKPACRLLVFVIGAEIFDRFLLRKYYLVSCNVFAILKIFWHILPHTREREAAKNIKFEVT